MKEIKQYDPMKAPDPQGWLRLDEGERIVLAEQYHRRARVKLPNARIHAVIHVVVESQVAQGDELPVRRTLDRLQAEGLDRHEAVHAVGSVLAKRMFDLMKAEPPSEDPNLAYWAELEQLTAGGWRRER